MAAYHVTGVGWQDGGRFCRGGTNWPPAVPGTGSPDGRTAHRSAQESGRSQGGSWIAAGPRTAPPPTGRIRHPDIPGNPVLMQLSAGGGGGGYAGRCDASRRTRGGARAVPGDAVAGTACPHPVREAAAAAAAAAADRPGPGPYTLKTAARMRRTGSPLHQHGRVGGSPRPDTGERDLRVPVGRPPPQRPAAARISRRARLREPVMDGAYCTRGRSRRSWGSGCTTAPACTSIRPRPHPIPPGRIRTWRVRTSMLQVQST